MNYSIKKISTSEEIELFHKLPRQIYRNCPQWIPPFRDEIEKIFDPARNPAFTRGECERFLVWNRGEVAGRFALLSDHTRDNFNPKMGGLGFVEMKDEQSVADAIVEYARVWHKRRGNGTFRGPVNFGENDSFWGLLVENFDAPPIYRMDYHPPYYQKRIEETGAIKLDDHWSYRRDFDQPLPERLVKITDRIEQRPGVELRSLDTRNIHDDAEMIREIYNDAWSNQDIGEREQEFTELTRETVREMVSQLRWVMIPDSILIAFVNGEPASFIVCVPDLNEISAETGGQLRWYHMPKVLRFRKRARRLRTIVFGTRPRYRKLGLEALTFIRGIQKTKAACPTLEYLEGAWVSEKNWLMQRSLEALGCYHFKTHRTYRWDV